MNIQVEVFWVVTLCSDAVGYRRFGGSYFLHFTVKGGLFKKQSNRVQSQNCNTPFNNSRYFNQNRIAMLQYQP
jgi:hypothetical protein